MRQLVVWSIMVSAIVAGVIGLRPMASAQSDGGSGHIVNGITTAAHPAVAALLSPANPNTASMVCSGTMIGCETFLTAAHCVCDSDGTLCTGALPPDPSDYVVFLQHAGFFAVTDITLRSDYDFPVADVALLKLGSAVTGISPVVIDTTGAGLGVSGTIVGFGRTGGGAADSGVKRAGEIVTASCVGGVSDTTSICWTYSEPIGSPGEDSNTCNGDSGGPLFIDYGAGPRIAGVTSGGDSFNCLAEDNSYDSRVSFYSSWIQSEGGADLGNTTCGSIAQVGGPAVDVVPFAGQLGPTATQALHSFQVPPATTQLRVSLNAIDSGLADFDLYVRAGSPPTTSTYDCAAVGTNQYGFCEHLSPAAGTWHVLVSRVVGTGPYQVTASVFGTDCTQPANEGQPCDDGNACTQNDACAAGACAGTAVINGTPCSDGNACSDPDTCQGGSCSGTPLTGQACDDGSLCTVGDQCQSGACIPGAAPAASCKAPAVVGKSSLLLRDKPDGADKLLWKWLKGSSTTLGELGDPPGGDTLALCIYDDSGLPELLAERVIPGGSAWITTGTGFKYKDRDAVSDGISNVVLKAGEDEAAKIIVRGKGDGLGLAPLNVGQLSSVLVQLVGTDACWEAHYSSGGNNPGEFRAKAD